VDLLCGLCELGVPFVTVNAINPEQIALAWFDGLATRRMGRQVQQKQIFSFVIRSAFGVDERTESVEDRVTRG
jgi:hypothetical protein